MREIKQATGTLGRPISDYVQAFASAPAGVVELEERSDWIDATSPGWSCNKAPKMI